MSSEIIKVKPQLFKASMLCRGAMGEMGESICLVQGSLSKGYHSGKGENMEKVKEP